MMIRCTYKIREAAVALLQFVAVCSLLSMVCVTTLELQTGEIIGQWVWFGKAALFSAGCVVASCFIQLLGKASWSDVLCFRYFFLHVAWSLVLLGTIEAVWGLRQLYGFSVSGHSLYVLTGSFFNPGPYGGYLAMILPICLHLYLRACERKSTNTLHKIEKVMAGVTGILTLCVLPATMSRSAWIAATISCAWVAYMHRDKRKCRILWQRYRKRCLSWGIAGLFIVILGGAGIFFLKLDSALGRLFLWKITCRAVVNYPWGCNEGFAYAYGEAQEAYFAQGNYAEWEERVAGSPEYVFNEYLSLALSVGILICAVVLIIIGVCFWAGIRRGRYGICGALLSLLVFSFSSYPLHLPSFIVAGVCLLLACGIGDVIGKSLVLCLCVIVWGGGYTEKWTQERDACRDWMNARVLYRSGAYKAANKAYEKLYPALGKKGAFLFEYGHSLHKSGHYQKSSELLDQARMCSNDPMILNIMGKNCQALRDYKSAEVMYQKSINRLPGRIYPYYLLAKLYYEPEFRDEEKFGAMKWNVLNRKPKVHSTAIEEMRMEVRELAKNWDDCENVRQAENIELNEVMP